MNFYLEIISFVLKLIQKHWFWPSGFDMRINDTVASDGNGVHVADLYTDKAIERIEKHDKTTPMFMVVSHVVPHTQGFGQKFPSSSEADKYYYIMNPTKRKLAGLKNLKIKQNINKTY